MKAMEDVYLVSLKTPFTKKKTLNTELEKSHMQRPSASGLLGVVGKLPNRKQGNVSTFAEIKFELNFGELMPVVWDAGMCYYECYRISNPGQHHLTRTEEGEEQPLHSKQREEGVSFDALIAANGVTRARQSNVRYVEFLSFSCGNATSRVGELRSGDQ